MHILLAEDSRMMAAPVIKALQDDGHCVTHVFDGIAAVEHYISNPPDLVLMDVEMPNMDGIQAVRKIKAMPVNKWIPIIMLTAHSAAEDIIQALEAGADDYLTKPLSMEILVARMRSKQHITDMQTSLFGILDNVHEGILTINERGLVQSYNRAAEKIFGYSATEVLGKNVNILMPEPYKTEHDGYLYNYMTTHQPKVIGIGRKVSGRRKSGEVFPMYLAVTTVQNPHGIQFIGLVRDIAEEEEARLRIEHLALHDTLTGLPNRAYFNQQITALIAISKPFALLFIDIDGFKPINDNFGHDTGDQVLITIAQRLTHVLTEQDFIARLGGDEFVVILQDITTPAKVERIGTRILEKISAPMRCNNNNCQVGASIGAAIYPLHGQDHEAILNLADNAMYHAKRSGKNKVLLTSQ